MWLVWCLWVGGWVVERGDVGWGGEVVEARGGAMVRVGLNWGGEVLFPFASCG